LQLFYSAFKAWAFNGIDGDQVVLGCCGGTTFRQAFRESRYPVHTAKLRAVDSFQSLHPAWIEGTMAISLDNFHEKCAANNSPRADYTTVPGFYELH